MGIKIGTQLGPYEITAPIGAGGMGEVYQARDARLNRTVAIKVSAERFSERFEREAKLIASLNHPNICSVFDVGPNFLVMELIEGETLAERIARGPLPVGEALKVAQQIVEALEAAHEKGIVHRDLKPANVKITPEGIVKVLDFGLAKAMEAAPSNVSLSNSPTMSIMATNAGVILGTAAYMSPEQAKGRTVDARTDIFAFGCVLFEMLTGRAAFDGEDITEILSRVLQREPDWNILPADTPEPIRRLLRRCLQKDRRQRLHAAADIRVEIEESSAETKREEIPASNSSRSAWVIASILLVAAAALAFLYFRQPPSISPKEMRLEITTPPTAESESMAISPDGQRIVFVATDSGQSRLFLRLLNRETGQPLAGTEGARLPFWSPDSRSVGFFAQGNLKRVDVNGGLPQNLTPISNMLGGTWGDGVILYVPTNFAPVMRIPASGGTATQVTKGSPIGTALYGPHFLPDGRHFLVGRTGPQGSGVYFASVDSSELQFLVNADSYTEAEYLRSGWLLYISQDVLFARGFDPSSGKVGGEAVTLADHVERFSVSNDGIVAYRIATGLARTRLVWMDRTGKPAGAMNSSDPRVAIANPELSPDGKRVAGDVTLDKNRDVWLLDSVRATRFTFDPAGDWMPIWSPDGKRIAFRSNRSGEFKLYEKASDGSGSEALLFDSAVAAMPDNWSRDGRYLLYQSLDPESGRDLWVFPRDGDHKPFIFLKTKYDEAYGQFSPDGRWVAYESNESGRTEVYVRPFPPAAGQWQVSTAGGSQARWRADGKELYFVAPDQKLMAASVTPKGTAVDIGPPAALFDTHLLGGGLSNYHQQYDVAKDGRFLLTATPEETAASSIMLILNWKPPNEK